MKKIIFLPLFLFIVISLNAQIKVGGNSTTKNDGSILEIESGTKGLLFPRVTLSSTTVWGLDGTPAAGMTVYNTATASDVTPGIYCYNGTKWIRIEAVEPWYLSGTTSTQATGNTQDIYQTGKVGIGVNAPTNQLHVSASSNPVRVQGLSSGVTTDSLLSVDNNGVMKQRSVFALRQDIVAPPAPVTQVFPGMIKFDTVSKNMQFYDGAVWQTFAYNIYSGKNEGVVKINSGAGGVIPTLVFTTQSIRTYKYINYTKPLIYSSSTYWPENSVQNDTNIIRSSGGNTTFIENNIEGQVTTWRIIGTFANKPSGKGGFITFELANPNPASTYKAKQYVPCQTQITTGEFNVIFFTIGDGLSLPFLNQGGVGYTLRVTSDVELIVNIQSITRISNYKD